MARGIAHVTRAAATYRNPRSWLLMWQAEHTSLPVYKHDMRFNSRSSRNTCLSSRTCRLAFNRTVVCQIGDTSHAFSMVPDLEQDNRL
jgi:hypothetical protein